MFVLPFSLSKTKGQTLVNLFESFDAEHTFDNQLPRVNAQKRKNVHSNCFDLNKARKVV